MDESELKVNSDREVSKMPQYDKKVFSMLCWLARQFEKVIIAILVMWYFGYFSFKIMRSSLSFSDQYIEVDSNEPHFKERPSGETLKDQNAKSDSDSKEPSSLEERPSLETSVDSSSSEVSVETLVDTGSESKDKPNSNYHLCEDSTEYLHQGQTFILALRWNYFRSYSRVMGTNCRSSSGKDRFSVHGLWCDEDHFCRPDKTHFKGTISIPLYSWGDRKIDNTTELEQIFHQYGCKKSTIKRMEVCWGEERTSFDQFDFWLHEFRKHGYSMASGESLGEKAVRYFDTTMKIWDSLKPEQALRRLGIKPTTAKPYYSDDIIAALKAYYGQKVILITQRMILQEIRFYFRIKGKVLNPNIEPVYPSVSNNCPKYVWYLPQ